MRIAYLINAYPAVSHTFIRREIHALERLGIEVDRIALRDSSQNLVDAEDLRERTLTMVVLKQGPIVLLLALIRTFLTKPLHLMRGLILAIRMGMHSDRPVPIHIIYLVEACFIANYARANRIQHIHAHFSTNSAEVALLVAELGGPPCSFTAHGVATLENPSFNNLATKVSKSKFVVGICSFARSQLFRYADFADWPKLHVVHCGLEPSYFALPAVPAPIQRRLVCVGRLSSEKAQVLLLEAAQILARQGVDFELVLAGDGELRPYIEELIVRYNLQARVRITGWLNAEQVRNEILAARALVLPSFAEGLPVVIMEAMAMRRPIISTYVAGIPELVRPGVDGWLVPSGDLESLVEAMRACLDAPVELLSRMGEGGHQRALERHNVDTEAAKLAKLFAA